MMFSKEQVHGTLKLFKKFYDKATDSGSSRFVVNALPVCKHLKLKDNELKSAKEFIRNFKTLKHIYRLAEVTDVKLKHKKNKDTGDIEPSVPLTFICEVVKVSKFSWNEPNTTKTTRDYKHGGIVTRISKPGRSESPYTLIIR